MFCVRARKKTKNSAPTTLLDFNLLLEVIKILNVLQFLKTNLNFYTNLKPKLIYIWLNSCTVLVYSLSWLTRRTTVNSQYVKYNFPLCMSSLYNMIVINLYNISVEIKIMRRDVLQ